MIDVPKNEPKTVKPGDKINHPVTHPAHYTQGDVECIDAIRASMTEEEFKGFLKGSAMKYLWRYRMKGNPVQDLEKSNWYICKLREFYQESKTHTNIYK